MEEAWLGVYNFRMRPLRRRRCEHGGVDLYIFLIPPEGGLDLVTNGKGAI